MPAQPASGYSRADVARNQPRAGLLPAGPPEPAAGNVGPIRYHASAPACYRLRPGTFHRFIRIAQRFFLACPHGAHTEPLPDGRYR